MCSCQLLAVEATGPVAYPSVSSCQMEELSSLSYVNRLVRGITTAEILDRDLDTCTLVDPAHVGNIEIPMIRPMRKINMRILTTNNTCSPIYLNLAHRQENAIVRCKMYNEEPLYKGDTLYPTSIRVCLSYCFCKHPCENLFLAVYSVPVNVCEIMYG